MKIYSNYILKLSSIYIIIKKNKLITNKQKKTNYKYTAFQVKVQHYSIYNFYI